MTARAAATPGLAPVSPPRREIPRQDDDYTAAVGLFDKDAPARAFGRLGPLAGTFPHAVTVRFHLGLLLLWLGQVDQAKKQLELARADAPSSALGHQAQLLLVRLANVRTRRLGR